MASVSTHRTATVSVEQLYTFLKTLFLFCLTSETFKRCRYRSIILFSLFLYYVVFIKRLSAIPITSIIGSPLFKVINFPFFFYTVAGIAGHYWRGWLFRSPVSLPGQQNGRPKVLATRWPERSPCSSLSLLHPTCSWEEMWVSPLCVYRTIFHTHGIQNVIVDKGHFVCLLFLTSQILILFNHVSVLLRYGVNAVIHKCVPYIWHAV